MKKSTKKLISLLALPIVCLFIFTFLLNYFKHIGYLVFWAIIITYIFFTTHWLYKREWREILSLYCNNISKKIILKSFWKGFSLSILINIAIMIFMVVFNAPVSKPYSDDTTLIYLLLSAILIAPIVEEIMFRGFMQGILQKNFSPNVNKLNGMTIIIITSLIFAFAHIRYIIYTGTMQWVLSIIGCFIAGIYLSNLRNKYQSIIPSMFAHLGFNFPLAVFIALMLIININDSNILKAISKELYLVPTYKNDSLYNFDPNNIDEYMESQEKFLTLNNHSHPEFKQFIKKGRKVTIPIYYDVDTNGLIYNVRIDTIGIKLKRDFYTSNEIERTAISLVESFPQHKPYIKNGHKEITTLYVYVPIYY